MCKNILEPDRPPVDNRARVHFTLGNKGYKHTIRICNNCFSIATMVAWTRLNIRCPYITCIAKCYYDGVQVWKNAATITMLLQCLKYSCKRDKNVCIRRFISPDWRSRLTWWGVGELFSVLKQISPWDVRCSHSGSVGASCLHVYYEGVLISP
jgi:hypothetical protein